MTNSRVWAGAALALTLTLAACGSDSPAADEQDPTESSSQAGEEGTTDAGESSPEYEEETDGEGGFDADAHPFCAVLDEYDRVTEAAGDPTELDLDLLRQARNDAIESAPAGIEAEVEIYFDTLVRVAEETAASGQAFDDFDVDELGEDFPDAFGAVIGFAFENCIDIDMEID